MLKRTFALFLILALTLSLMACKRTTLDRVGAVLIQASALYVLELDQLKAQGVLSDEKYSQLRMRASAIQTQASVIAATIAGFPEGKVTRENSAQVVAQLGLLAGNLSATLADPAIANLSPDARIIKALGYFQATAAAVSLTLAGLFPPPLPGAESGSDGIKASKVKIELPDKPKGL